jgi:C4-type Zn-finger protein
MARTYKNRKKSKSKRKRERSFHNYITKNEVTLRYRDPVSNLVVKTVTYHDVELSQQDLRDLKDHKKIKHLKTTTDAGWHHIHWCMDCLTEGSVKVLLPR